MEGSGVRINAVKLKFNQVDFIRQYIIWNIFTCDYATGKESFFNPFPCCLDIVDECRHQLTRLDYLPGRIGIIVIPSPKKYDPTSPGPFPMAALESARVGVITDLNRFHRGRLAFSTIHLAERGLANMCGLRASRGATRVMWCVRLDMAPLLANESSSWVYLLKPWTQNGVLVVPSTSGNMIY
jgi:hypothetical protein